MCKFTTYHTGAKQYFSKFFFSLKSCFRVTLGRNESVVLIVAMFVDPSVLPYTTNTLVVTAISNRGDTSHTQAHLSVVPKVCPINLPFGFIQLGFSLLPSLCL